MSETILFITAGIELGILLGYATSRLHRWSEEGRAMYLHFCSAIRRAH